jgi:very-short-patch-repair endonuclease
VETDGWAHHRTRAASEDDRHRDALDAAAGYRTLRFSHEQLTARQGDIVRALEAVITARPAA